MCMTPKYYEVPAYYCPMDCRGTLFTTVEALVIHIEATHLTDHNEITRITDFGFTNKYREMVHSTCKKVSDLQYSQ